MLLNGFVTETFGDNQCQNIKNDATKILVNDTTKILMAKCLLHLFLTQKTRVKLGTNILQPKFWW